MLIDLLSFVDAFVQQENTTNQMNEPFHGVSNVLFDEKIFPNQFHVKMFNSKNFETIVQRMEITVRRTTMEREGKQSNDQFHQRFIGIDLFEKRFTGRDQRRPVDRLQRLLETRTLKINHTTKNQQARQTGDRLQTIAKKNRSISTRKRMKMSIGQIELMNLSEDQTK